MHNRYRRLDRTTTAIFHLPAIRLGRSDIVVKRTDSEGLLVGVAILGHQCLGQQLFAFRIILLDNFVLIKEIDICILQLVVAQFKSIPVERHAGRPGIVDPTLGRRPFHPSQGCICPGYRSFTGDNLGLGFARQSTDARQVEKYDKQSELVSYMYQYDIDEEQ